MCTALARLRGSFHPPAAPGLDELCAWLLSRGDDFQWEWSLGTPGLAPDSFSGTQTMCCTVQAAFELKTLTSASLVLG